jgi:hypothetical protein
MYVLTDAGDSPHPAIHACTCSGVISSTATLLNASSKAPIAYP